MKWLAISVFSAVCLFLTSEVFAATCSNGTGVCFYVTSVGAGSKDGSSWANAYAGFPTRGQGRWFPKTALARGATYYIADGDYPLQYEFNQPASGTQRVTLKKATLEDHGSSDAGWNSGMGDGQATFRGPWVFIADGLSGGYITFDGYSSHAPGNYGFRVVSPPNQMLVMFPDSAAGTHPNIKFSYIDFDGSNGSGYVAFCPPQITPFYSYGDQPVAFYTYYPERGEGPSSIGFYISPHIDSGGYYDTSNMLISHCAIHGVATMIQDKGNAARGLVLEYSDLYDSLAVVDAASVCDHGNIYWVDSNDLTIRYNKIHNWNVEGLFLGGGTSNHKIYGNIFYDGVGVAKGITFRSPQSFSNIKIHQNTFANLPPNGMAVRVMSGTTISGVEGRNNLFYNATGVTVESGVTGSFQQSNNITAVAGDFLNAAGKDFHLTKHNGPGINLGLPYDLDRDGTTRSTWDIGAYEYRSIAGVPPYPPSNLKVE